MANNPIIDVDPEPIGFSTQIVDNRGTSPESFIIDMANEDKSRPSEMNSDNEKTEESKETRNSTIYVGLDSDSEDDTFVLYKKKLY